MLSREEVAKLLSEPKGTEPLALRDRALLEVMYACGLRASEAIGLEVGDVDLEEGMLRARGKGSKERVVPVGRQAVRRSSAMRTWAPRAGGYERGEQPVRQPSRRCSHASGSLQDRPGPCAQRRAGAG